METNNTNPEDKTNENLEQIEEKKKDKTLIIKRVLFATIGILILFLIVLALIFAFRDNKEEPTKDSSHIEKPIQANENSVENVPSEPQVVEAKFDFNNLEPEKLNEQLELLTNKNMEHQKEKEQKTLEEEKKLSPIFNLVNNLKDKEETKKEDKEEQPIITPKELSTNQENKTQNIPNTSSNLEKEVSKNEEIKQEVTQKENSEKIQIIPTTNENQVKNINESNSDKTIQTESLDFVKLINVAKIKGSLNKKYLDKIVDINTNILLCRDDENIIELYYGPFLEDTLRDDLLSNLIKNGFKEAYSLEMTKEEFDKRCNY